MNHPINSQPPLTELHVHTTASDGVHSPEEVIQRIASRNIRVVSITDHDTTAALSEAQYHCNRYGIDFVNGIEISCFQDGSDIHILGYGFTPDDEQLEAKLRSIRIERILRAEKILEKLQSLNISLSLDEVGLRASNHALGRPHIAKALVDRGYAYSMIDAFNKYLGDTAVAYVPKPEFSVKEAVELLHSAGGIAVLAHPMRMLTMRKIVDCINDGVDGIEACHPSHSKANWKYLRSFAKHWDVLVTGGSDFHGSRFNEERNIGQFSLSEVELRAFSLAIARKDFRILRTSSTNTIGINTGESSHNISV